MTAQANTVLDQIEVRGDGTINLRFDKQVVIDGKVVAREWHRAGLPPNTDIDAMAAAVNKDLGAIGYPPISDADLTRIKAMAAHVWGK